MGRLRVAINGFGRIGRIALRAAFDKVDIVGINDVAPTKTLAHLLKYDSVHGQFNHDVKAEENALIVGGKRIPVSTVKNPQELPWKQLEVDVVFECTGVLKKKEDFEKHILAGAKRVLVSAPADGVDLTVVYGVNHTDFDPSKHRTISNASCTTNCLAPLAKVINDSFGIEKALITTVHSYTNDQRVVDATHSDLRRARAAALSMIPTTTGAARTVGKVLPALKGKIDGTSIRVPTPNVSVVDLVATTEKPVSIESINQALTKAAEGPLKGVLAVEANELVSTDFNGNTNSSIIDLPSTMVMGDKMLKVFSWYDNEVGFSNRMVDFALYMQSKGI